MSMQSVDKGTKTLSEAQQLLLMRYCDGECNFLSKRRAQKLVNSVPEAAEFVSTMGAVKREVVGYSASSESKADLWQQISRRIDQEQRAELFLGKRGKNAAAESNSGFGQWLTHSAGWVFSGAAVTAALAFFVFVPNANQSSGSQIAKNQQSGTASNLDIQPVANHERPRIINETLPNVVEVDWMRSDGRVRMLHDPSERSAFIWVKRRDPRAQVRQNRHNPVVVFDNQTGLGLPSGK